MNAGTLTPQRRFLLWQVAVVGLVSLWATWLAALWQWPRSVGVLVAGWLAVGGVGLGIVALLLTTPPNAIKLPRLRSERMILGLLAALLILTLLLTSPVWSNDHERYLTEGAMWSAGTSPYTVPPAAFDPDTRANHPELVSIYPPVAQAVFAAVHGLSSRSGVNGELLFRGIVGVSAWLAAWVLLRLLAEMDRSAWWAAPVVLSGAWMMETAGTPHIDMVGVLAMLLGLWSAQRGKGLLAGLCLGLACGVKPQVVVLVPFVARARPAVWIGVVLAGLPQLGVLLWQGGGAGFLRTSSLYATSWEANGSLFELFKAFAPLGEDRAAIARLKDVGRMAGPVLLVLAFWLLWRFRATHASAGLVLQGVLLLASPVVYPWYLLWILPLAVLVQRPEQGMWALIWGVTVVWSYLLGQLGLGWTLPVWAVLLEYIPVYAWLMAMLVMHLRSPPDARTMPS